MKKVDYPHCTLKDALDIAQIIDSSGGETKLGVVADQKGMSEKGGGFLMKIHGAVKYGLIRKEGEDLRVTDLGDRILHPTNDYEKEMALIEAVKHVPIFDKLINKFNGREIQKEYLTNILIREFDISKKFAGRVSYYFFKANEIANFLKQVKKGVFALNVEDSNLESEDDFGDDEEDFQPKKVIQKKTGKIDEKTFNLIYSLGLLSGNFGEAFNEIKSLLPEMDQEFSHFKLLFDFMASQFEEKIISEDQFKLAQPKLITSIKKDLGLNNEDENNNHM